MEPYTEFVLLHLCGVSELVMYLPSSVLLLQSSTVERGMEEGDKSKRVSLDKAH